MKPDWDPQLLKVTEMFRLGTGQDLEARTQTAKEIWKIAVEQMWSIGTVGQSVR